MMTNEIAGLTRLYESVRGGRKLAVFLCGDSSLRGLLPGDLVTVEETGSAGIHAGDLVLGFDTAGRPGMYQVIAARRMKTGILFVVRGEYSLFFDDVVAGRDCAGKIISIRRGGRLIGCEGVSRKWGRFASVVLLRLKRVAAAAVRVLQATRIYGVAVKKLVDTGELSFRKATEEDIPALCRLFSGRLWPMGHEQALERMVFLFRLPGRRWFLAVRKGRIAAALSVDPYPAADGGKAWYLDAIFVPIQLRRLGIASRLVCFVLAEGEKEGVTEFRGVTVAGNRKAAEEVTAKGKIKFELLGIDENPSTGWQARIRYAVKPGRGVSGLNTGPGV